MYFSPKVKIYSNKWLERTVSKWSNYNRKISRKQQQQRNKRNPFFDLVIFSTGLCSVWSSIAQQKSKKHNWLNDEESEDDAPGKWKKVEVKGKFKAKRKSVLVRKAASAHSPLEGWHSPLLPLTYPQRKAKVQSKIGKGKNRKKERMYKLESHKVSWNLSFCTSWTYHRPFLIRA